MKTNVFSPIKDKAAAEQFLTRLYRNGEAIHPDDDAKEIIWDNCQPTKAELNALNERMEEISSIEGFDPCDFLLCLIYPQKYIVTDKSGRSAKPYEMTREQIASIGEGEDWEQEWQEWFVNCESGDVFSQNNIKIQAL